jgi:hypothetical protein
MSRSLPLSYKDEDNNSSHRLSEFIADFVGALGRYNYAKKIYVGKELHRTGKRQEMKTLP